MKDIEIKRVEPIEIRPEDFPWLEAGLVPRREMTREEIEREFPSVTAHQEQS